MTKLERKPIERIVVRGANWVGDAVLTVPAMRELRRIFPKAHITLATRAWARGLFADADFIDELLVHQGAGLRSVVQQVREWRKHSFDLAVLFPNSLEAALVASLSRVPIRIGYATDGRQRLLTHPLPVPEWRSTRHEVFYYLQVVAQLEWQIKGQETYLGTEPNGLLPVSETRLAAAQNLLRGAGVTEGRPLIALCPGSINSRAKRWPAERYAALADRLIDEAEAEVLLIGSAAEVDVSQEVARQMRNKVIMLTGRTDLAEVVAIIGLVNLLITNDTGPAHIAAALRRRALVIFGPTNVTTTRPFSPLAEIVVEPPDCAPCMLRDCPIDHRCMTAISPDDVFERAGLMLSDKLQFVDSRHSQFCADNDKRRFVGQVK